MRSILLLIPLLSFFFSCSDPIFWTLQNEEKIKTSNLNKKAAVTGMASDGTNYFVSIGSQLFYRPMTGDTWKKIGFNGRVTGIGGPSGSIKVATSSGVYSLNGTSIDALVDPAVNAKIMPDGAIVSRKSEGYVQVNGSGTYVGDVVGTISAGTYVDMAGQNTVVTGKTVTGADDGFVATNEAFGKNSDWDNKFNFAGSKSIVSAATLGLANLEALVGSNGGGYFEAYIKDDGKMGTRSPKETVENSSAYEASDLASAVVLGFFKGDNGVFFIMTANKGLWSNTNKTWKWE